MPDDLVPTSPPPASPDGARDDAGHAGGGDGAPGDGSGTTALLAMPGNVSAGDPSRYVAHAIEEIPAADGAAVLENLTSTEAANVAEFLDPETAAGILSQMDTAIAATVVADMEEIEGAMVLSAMDPDDRVDILEHLPVALRERLIGHMDAPDAAEVRRLQQYPPDSAGGIMTTEVTALPDDLTVEEAIGELRRLSETLEQMFYVYVTDRRRRLVGVLSMRDLILARPNRPVRDLMRKNVTSVLATVDQEEVARVMRKYGYLAMPVVDQGNRLLGIITVDDVVDVLEEEATEDVQKMFGAGAEERLTSPWQYSFKKRVWWLEVNLLTAFMAAAVVAMFRDTIAAVPILAAYQTIVSGMGGNASAQAMAVAIRGIALGEVDRSLLNKILYRELIVGVMSGLSIGGTTAVIAVVFNYNGFAQAGHHTGAYVLGLIVFLALLLNHINACVTGVTVPFVMKRLGFDPAQSATIFATTFTDCGGFFVCLGLAKLCMRWLVPVA